MNKNDNSMLFAADIVGILRHLCPRVLGAFDTTEMQHRYIRLGELQRTTHTDSAAGNNSDSQNNVTTVRVDRVRLIVTSPQNHYMTQVNGGPHA